MMKNVCLKSKSSLFLTIATIVLALLLIMQILITAWLYPRPYRTLSEHKHQYLSAEDVLAAADALEREFIWKSLRNRSLLLNISYNFEHPLEDSYLEEHPGLKHDNLIVFRCYIFYPDTGGTTPMHVAMERDGKGEWHIATISG